MRRRFLNNIQSIPNDYHSEYFTIEALEDDLTVSFNNDGLEYKINSNEWSPLSRNVNISLVNTGDKISFRGNIIPSSTRIEFGVGTFTVNKTFNAEGNIMSLLYGDNFEGQNDLSGTNYSFYELFYNCTTLKNAKNLILPATTLANECYSSMFGRCISLTTAPALPATELAESCYFYMFEGCTSLTKAPALPATELAESCYFYMFEGCTSLTTAPELPATTLASNCYEGMFNYSVNLTTAPELPATILVYGCYYSMFRGCSKLNYIKMLATDISAGSCLDYWVEGVASSGTFIKNHLMTTLFTGTSGIPEGWTVEDYNEPVHGGGN